LQRDRLDILLQPAGHFLFFFEVGLQQAHGFGVTGGVGKSQQRFVGGDFVILESEVGEAVLHDFIGRNGVAHGGHGATE
jgi:hypothetical protein